MMQFEWKATSTGYRSTPLGEKYILEIWDTESTASWYAGVNNQIIKDSEGNHRKFDDTVSAQTAAEKKASEMMEKDGIINSNGN